MEKKTATLTAAPFRGLPQPEAHYRSVFNCKPGKERLCVVRFRVGRYSKKPFTYLSAGDIRTSYSHCTVS
ncbi:hypothetical protein FJT53_05070 [Salmonella enterica]|nr:hypothetical protein [Salmonella enterica]